jgi:hypothetical protein
MSGYDTTRTSRETIRMSGVGVEAVIRYLFGRLDRSHRFRAGRSPRISLNSFGPLRRRRFLVSRSSSVADGSPISSICRAARSAAFDPTFAWGSGAGWPLASPSLTRRLMASDRVLVPLSFDHSSIWVMISRGNRRPISGLRPVAGLPRFSILRISS